MSTEHLFREYLAKVEHAHRAGNATEHTYRPYLKTLLESLVVHPHITATNEPRRVACGAPDYVVSTDTHSGPFTIGYVEAKDVGISLTEILKTDQLRRYLSALDNLVLTDYLEFRWFTNGEHRLTVRLADLKNGHLTPNRADWARAEELLVAFLEHNPQYIRSPKDLAQRMARLAHMIRDLAVESFTQQTASHLLTGLYDSFRQVLIPELTEAEFADMFAQTLAYGLFAARTRHDGPIGSFRREYAAREIPRTNPFLRRLFGTITGPDLDDEPFAGFVDDLTQLLAYADMETILADFGRRTRQEDPIVHFYETFLSAYDPKLRELRGVYYTPEPVVSYIVRSVDAILKRDFGLPDGVADSSEVPAVAAAPSTPRSPRVLMLDPACGTGTFLYKVIDLIRERFAESGNVGMWSSYVRKHLLSRLFGFELLMAPYAVAHLKLGMQLAAMDLDEALRRHWAYDFSGDERLGVYLTNTLDEAAKKAERLTLGEYISEEANEAAAIKRDDPVMVVLGNPPYSGHSANKGTWITNLLRGEDLLDTQGNTLKERGKGTKTGNYFEVDGQSLGERNPKWLNDDYVKFIRFAQWRIERTGHGVLAFITNHGYLDNPTFRGMRQSLMQSFDEIHVLNLHGNSKKKERAPDGGKDENVFDIQQGVAIGIFIRRPGSYGATRQAKVYHADLWGVRESKYTWLEANDVMTTQWTEIQPHGPFYLFMPRETDLEAEYQQGWSIPQVFPVNASTVTTARNHFSMAYDAETLVSRVSDLQSGLLSDEDIKRKYNLEDVSYWTVKEARRQIKELSDVRSSIRAYAYRPFDNRFVIYHEAVCERLRLDVMRNMMAPNIAFLTHRPQSPGDFTFAYCTSLIGDQCVAANKTAGGGNSYQYPLYLYPDTSKTSLWDGAHPLPDTPGGRSPNLAPAFISDFSARLGLAWVSDGKGDRMRTFGPEDVFSYMYAVFHSPEYRERYAEFLKTDFPRLALTSDVDLFRALCALGDQLVGLHLMERRAPAITRYPVTGNNAVEKVRYTAPGEGAEQGRVWINAHQYFEGVPLEVWEFHVGGYQVCEKWLKDRKGRTLTFDDLTHYQQVVAALAETIRLMAAIDETIEDHGGWPLA